MTPAENIVHELRDLIIRSAPDPFQTQAVITCGEHEELDTIVPFSSIIMLGVIVAIEDRFGIRVTRQSLEATLKGSPTLAKLASMVVSLQRNHE